MMNEILYWLNFIVFVIFGYSTLYIFIFAFAGLFHFKQKKPKDNKKRRFVILIPGYKEDAIIVDVAKDALQQNYDKSLYDVVIIADGFKKETVTELEKTEVIVVNVKLEYSTKSRAINAGLRALKKEYDVAIVLDADNIMEKDFLNKLNTSFSAGNKVVQAHRVAKNNNSKFAILDAVSEEINNHIIRQGHRVLGFSSALIGSAMAFDYSYFKKMMAKVEVVGGFDKELEVLILRERIKIEYLPDAFVYDEKVSTAEVFSEQRRRWLAAQIHFFGKSFLPALKELLVHGNFDLFDKALQFVLVPRIMLLGMLFIFSLVAFVVAPSPIFILWFLLLLLCIVTFFLSIPYYFYGMNTLRALLKIPSGFYHMFLSLLKVKGANDAFIHTKHSYNTFQKHKKRKL